MSWIPSPGTILRPALARRNQPADLLQAALCPVLAVADVDAHLYALVEERHGAVARPEFSSSKKTSIVSTWDPWP